MKKTVLVVCTDASLYCEKFSELCKLSSAMLKNPLKIVKLKSKVNYNQLQKCGDTLTRKQPVLLQIAAIHRSVR